MNQANVPNIQAELSQLCEQMALYALRNYDHAQDIHPADIWTQEDRDRLARECFVHALKEMDRFAEVGLDPAIVLRAAEFLSYHATPHFRDDPAWFVWSLEALLLLIEPSVTVSGYKPFHSDVIRAGERLMANDFWRNDKIDPKSKGMHLA
jgi:hypothetical protein